MARKITLAELKKMAAKLNALKLGKENLLEAIGAEKCKTSGKFDALADSFMDAMEACADDDKASKKVPKVIEVFHNRLFDQVNPEEEDPETEPDEGEEEPEEGEEEPEEGEEPDEGEEGEEGKRTRRRRRKKKPVKKTPAKKKGPKGGVSGVLMRLVCDFPNLSFEKISEKLEKSGKSMSEGTALDRYNWCQNVINYLNEKEYLDHPKVK